MRGNRPLAIAALVAFLGGVAAAQEAPPTLQICAVDAASGIAVPNAVVILVNSSGGAATLTAGTSGCATAAGLKPGNYKMSVFAAGTVPADLTFSWPSSKTRLVARLKVQEATQATEMTIEASREKQEEQRLTITPEEAQTLPGTNGDAIKVIQDLPGMARSPFNTGALLIQGSAPQDSEVFLDGQLIPQLYHFGGLTSVVNSEVLSAIDYLPGGFGVRYGGAIGGVVDLSTHGAKEHPDVIADANLIDAQIVGQTPIGTDGVNGRVIGTIRRSYIDTIVNAVVPANALAFSVFPRYYDYQVRYDAPTTGSGATWHLLVYGSNDLLGFLPKPPSGTLGAARGGFSYGTEFHRLQFQWAQPLPGNWVVTLIPSVGYQDIGLNAGSSISIENIAIDGSLRAEANGKIGERIQALFGVEAHLENDRTNINIIGGFGGGGRVIEDDSAYNEGKSGVYAQTNVDVGEHLHIIPGVRVDGFEPTNQVTADPRLALRWEPSDDWMGRAYAGVYHQPPTPQQWDKTLGDPALLSPYADQFGLGGRHRFDPSTTVESDVFWKWMGNQVIQSPADAALGQVKGSYTNNQVGRAYGWEVLAKREMGGPFYGWIAYTLSRSERTDPYTPGGWYPFQYDQTHILTVLAGWKISKRWTVGARYRYTTGDPYTGVVGAVLDGQNGGYEPISGTINGDRLPSFQQLDVRVDDRFVHWGAHWDLYLDLENALNTKNPEIQRYNYDYTQETYITGLPIIPSLGIRVEWP